MNLFFPPNKEQKKHIDAAVEEYLKEQKGRGINIYHPEFLKEMEKYASKAAIAEALDIKIEHYDI